MLPFVEVGPHVLSTFTLFHLLALWLGAALLRERLVRRGPTLADLWPALAVGAAFGGILGARLWGAVEAHDLAAWVKQPLAVRAGGSWLGGLVGSSLLCAALWRIRRTRPPFLELADAAAPCAGFGLAIARVGCFLSGDSCHGVPSELPWAVAYPHGLSPTRVTVHPTELYEGFAVAALSASLLRMSRRNASPGRVAGWFLVGSGLIRLLVEALRGHRAVVVGLTAAQIASLLLVVAGALGLLLLRRSPGREGSRSVSSVESRASAPLSEVIP